MSSFCTQLTTLTQAEVEGGVDFAEACALLRREYGTKERVWASYGDFDRQQFLYQCRERDIPYPFGRTHLNVKNLFALAKGLHKEVSLLEAVTIMNWPLEGTYHRGDDDAWNIARLLGALLRP